MGEVKEEGRGEEQKLGQSHVASFLILLRTSIRYIKVAYVTDKYSFLRINFHVPGNQFPDPN